LEQRPLLEVQVELSAPEPHLRARLDEIVKSKNVRLVRVAPPIYTGTGHSLAEATPGVSLADLDREKVFAKRWERDYKTDVIPEEYLTAFRELVQAAEEIERKKS
jgi:exonuclease SbcD